MTTRMLPGRNHSRPHVCTVGTPTKTARRDVATPSTPSPWLTGQDLLNELGIPRSTWDKWRQRDAAPRAIKLPNGQLRIHRNDLDEWTRSLPDALCECNRRFTRP